MAIEWTPKISVSDETIDGQYKKLLGQINQLLYALGGRHVIWIPIKWRIWWKKRGRNSLDLGIFILAFY